MRSTRAASSLSEGQAVSYEEVEGLKGLLAVNVVPTVLGTSGSDRLAQAIERLPVGDDGCNRRCARDNGRVVGTEARMFAQFVVEVGRTTGALVDPVFDEQLFRLHHRGVRIALHNLMAPGRLQARRRR